MPLKPGNSRETISTNIKEMQAAGHPHNVSVAAALHNADKSRKFGGKVPKMAMGGDMMPMSEASPWFERSEARSAFPVHEGGLLTAPSGGRTDNLSRNVPVGSFVMPADVVSGLGEGNTMAGAAVMDRMMHSLPYGIKGDKVGGRNTIPHAPAPYRQPAAGSMEQVSKGGKTRHTPVVVAGGEYIIPPEKVAQFGHGDLDHGHKVLHAFVKRVRKKTIDKMSSLKPPKK